MSILHNKRTRSGLYINNHKHMLMCPICNSSMRVQDLQSITCPNRHTFDIAKQGHLNVMTRQIQTNYDKTLFEARRKVIINSNLFKPLHTTIIKMIGQHTENKHDLSIIDMGSGEGSHLYTIANALQTDGGHSITSVGIDISKEGILEAAKHYENHMWIAADLSRTPFQDHTFDVILNILSPSNYEEFNRLLIDDGIMIKVVPRGRYLQELRQHFHRDSGRKDYSNEKVVEHLKNKLDIIDQSTTTYTCKLNQSDLQYLIQMTPLSWHAAPDHVTHFLNTGENKITIDLDILVVQKK